MDRAFAIAPTASCSYRYIDRAGYTTAPELAPPIGRQLIGTAQFWVSTYDYGNVETAEDVGWNDYKRVVDGIMELLLDTGLAHGYGNSWVMLLLDNDFIEEWLRSPQTTVLFTAGHAEHAS